MFKRQTGRAVSAAGIALAIIPLAACDGGFIERPGARFADVGFPAQRDAGAGRAIAAKPTSVEQRHFDFYTRYRSAFEAMPQNLHSDVDEVSGGPANDAGRSHGGAAEAGPSCSVRTLLKQN